MIVRLLIQQAYRDAQILAEEGENASSTQLSQGLILFNRLLRKISIDGFEIPITTEESFNLTTGQNYIDLIGWTKVLKAQYLNGSLKLEIYLLDQNTYLSNSVITNTSGIPTIGYAKRIPTGIKLSVFFTPDSDYQLYVTGYKMLSAVIIDTELDGSIEGFMQDYLMYQLAYDLRIYYQLPELSFLRDKLRDYESRFQNLKSRRTDRFNFNIGESGNSFAAINLSRGYSP